MQDAFAKALEQDHPLEGKQLDRWLVRVATNLSLSRLRSRRRRFYEGSWLPSPFESETSAESSSDESVDSGYEMADSVSHIPAATRSLQQEALAKFVACMIQQDAAGMEALLSDDVRSINDAAGRYTALREPLAGRARRTVPSPDWSAARADLHDRDPPSQRRAGSRHRHAAANSAQMAPRLVLRLELDDVGRIREIHTVLAPDKLTAISFLAPPAACAIPEAVIEEEIDEEKEFPLVEELLVGRR